MTAPVERGKRTIVKGCAMLAGGGAPIDARLKDAKIAASRWASPVESKSRTSRTCPEAPIQNLITNRYVPGRVSGVKHRDRLIPTWTSPE